MRWALVAAAFVMLCAASGLSPAAAENILRYAVLDADKVNLRAGPGLRYPVEWVFVRRGWPVEIISEFGYWRKVRDIDGTSGWVHRNLLSAKRRVIVMGDIEIAYRDPDPAAEQVMMLEKGVVADLEECDGDWCQIVAGSREGWARRDKLWGTEDAPE